MDNQRTSWAAACAVVVLLTAVCFSPWLIDGRVLAPFDILTELAAPWASPKSGHVPEVHNHFVSDAATQYIPYAMFGKSSYAADGYIGWNPMVFGGVAQHANTMALYFDWSQQLYRWLDFWTAWHTVRMAQMLIAGLGMLVFLHGRGCASGVAGMAAVAYMVNSQFVAWIYHHWALSCFCWMPWLLWALYAARERSAKYLASAAIFLTLSLLGGTLQHAAYVLLVMICVWAGWLWEERRDARAMWRLTWMFITTGMLGAGLAAYMLEPTIAAYLENVQAGQVRGGLGYDGGIFQPLLNTLALPFYALPMVMGSPQSLDLWKVLKSDAFNVASFGTVPVVLAGIGLFSRKVPMPAKLLMGAGLIIPLTPLVGPLYHRVQLLWILGGCWAGAAWLAAAGMEQRQKISRWLWIGLIAVVVAWFVASVALAATMSWMEPMLRSKVAAMSGTSQFGIYTEWMKERASALLEYLLIWNPSQIVALGAVALTIWGLQRVNSTKWWLQMAAAVGVAIQISVFWWQWTTWSEDKNPYDPPALVHFLQSEVGPDGRLAQQPGKYATTPLGPNTLDPAGVPIVGGYDSIHPLRMITPTGNSWDFPGTTHYLGAVNGDTPSDWFEIWTDGDWRVLRNPNPALGIAAMDNGPMISLGADAVRRKTFNTMEVYLERGTKSVEVYTNWQRGWKWRADDGRTWQPTLRGSVGGVAVTLPEPTSKKTNLFFRYDPSPPAWVLILCGLSAAGIAVLAVLGKGTQRV